MRYESSFAPVSSFLGKVEAMALSVGGDPPSARELAITYHKITRSFPKSIHFYLIARFDSGGAGSDYNFRNEFQNEFKKLNGGRKINLIMIDFSVDLKNYALRIKKYLGCEDDKLPSDLDFHKWVQDSFLVLNSRDQDVILLDPMFPGEKSLGDSLLAEVIAMKTNISLRPFPYFLTGGNTLVGQRTDAFGETERFILVGAGDLWSNIGEFGKPDPVAFKETLERELKEALNVDKVIWIHLPPDEKLKVIENFEQPFVHIDMYVSILGSSKQGARCRVLVGDVKELKGKDQNQEVKDRKEKLNEVAIQLEKEGFEVDRIPLVVQVNDQDTVTRIFSFNNCIVEVFDGTSRVFLPTYGPELGSFYSQAKARFEYHKFQVFPVEGMEWHSDNNGSIHCLTKDLVRDYFPFGKRSFRFFKR